MAGNKIIDKVYEYALGFSKEIGLTIYEVEFKKEGSDYVLRVVVDSLNDEKNVSIDECEYVSRKLSDILDTELNDLIDKAYMLEVTSPGIDRELKKDEDFIRFKGKLIDVKLYKAIDKNKIITGTLISKDDEFLKLSQDNGDIDIDTKNIAQIRLSVIW